MAMRRLMTSAVVVLAVALLAPVSRAQMAGATIGTPPQTTGSVNGTLGHAGVMPIPMGVSPAPARAFPAPTPIGVPPTVSFPARSVSGGVHHHHPHRFPAAVAYPVYVPVPVVVDPYSMYQPDPGQMPSDQVDDQAVVPGPTVFERRPADDDSALAETSDPAPTPAEPAAPLSTSAGENAPAAQPQLVQPQDPSVLVFRDGHRLEIENYAIVGDALYDLTPGHVRRIALSQLDLAATVKANDDRGVDFTLPASIKGE